MEPQSGKNLTRLTIPVTTNDSDKDGINKYKYLCEIDIYFIFLTGYRLVIRL